MIIYLRGNQSSQFTFGKGFIFVQGLTGWMSAMPIWTRTQAGRAALATGSKAMSYLRGPTSFDTYISGTAFTTSVQSKSICESNDFKAKTLSSGSGSDRKPTRPPAETSPTIAIKAVVERQSQWDEAQIGMRMLSLGIESRRREGAWGSSERPQAEEMWIGMQ